MRELTLTVPDLAATRLSFLPMLLIIGLTAVAAGFLGTRVAMRSLGTSGIKANVVTELTESPDPGPTTSAATTGANIMGINVNLRTGPGIGYPIAGRLQPGEGLAVQEQRGGWCSVTTSSGIAGWVHGAYVSGIGGPDHSAAIVRRLIVSNGIGGRVVLQPGQRVLRVSAPDGRAAVLLPDGRQISVGEGVLADAR
jgi:hypothetical protein